LASEFRYRDPLVEKDSLTIIIYQSGETADTLAGLREAKRLGSRILAINQPLLSVPLSLIPLAFLFQIVNDPSQ